MKKTIFFAALCSMLLVMTGCEQILQGTAENMCKAMLAGKVNSMREYPNDIQACDSIMQANYYVADKLVDMGTTTWKRENCGYLSRSKRESINGASVTISYEADATYSRYNSLYVGMWFLDAHKAAGEPKEFRGVYDDQTFDTYDELSQLLSEAPAQGITAYSIHDGVSCNIILEVTSNGQYHLKYNHSDVIMIK